MTSGVKVCDEVVKIYNEMKVVKSDNTTERIRVVNFEIKDNQIKVKTIVREKDLDKDGNAFKVFQDMMQKSSCCYLLYDCHFEIVDTHKEELVFVMWSCDGAKCKDKMTYASSKQAIKDAMPGIKHNMEINDSSDYQLSAFAEKLGKTVLGVEGMPLIDDEDHGHGQSHNHQKHVKK